MKRFVGAFGVVVNVVLSPEFRPFEVRLVKAVAIAVAAYFGASHV